MTASCVRIKKKKSQQAPSPLKLLFEDNRGLPWAQKMAKEEHYLHTRVHDQGKPLAYVITKDGEWVGCFIFARPQASHVHEWHGKEADRHPGMHWFGNLEEVEAGKCLYTQWEILNLARVWLHPKLQDPESPDYVPNAISQLLPVALKRVAFDYLAYYPPAFLDEPYELRQCISYCYADRAGTIYKANNFEPVRVSTRKASDGSKQLMTTYMRPLRGLSHEERRTIAQASIQQADARQKRASEAFHAHMILTPMFHRRRRIACAYRRSLAA